MSSNDKIAEARKIAAGMRNDDPQFSRRGMTKTLRSAMYLCDIETLLDGIKAVAASMDNPSDLYAIRLQLASIHGMEGGAS